MKRLPAVLFLACLASAASAHAARVGVLVKQTVNPITARVFSNLYNKLTREGHSVVVLDNGGINMKPTIPTVGEKEFRASDLDVAFAISGDGGLLKLASILKRTPFGGINTGGEGAWLHFQPNEEVDFAHAALAGQLPIEKIPTLDVTLQTAKGCTEHCRGINELYIWHGKSLHLLTIKAKKWDPVKMRWPKRPSYKVRGDGVIVATPYGSTGVNYAYRGIKLKPIVEYDPITKAKTILPNKSWVITPVGPFQGQGESKELHGQPTMSIHADTRYKEDDLMVSVDGEVHKYEVGNKVDILLKKGRPLDFYGKKAAMTLRKLKQAGAVK